MLVSLRDVRARKERRGETRGTKVRNYLQELKADEILKEVFTGYTLEVSATPAHTRFGRTRRRRRQRPPRGYRSSGCRGVAVHANISICRLRYCAWGLGSTLTRRHALRTTGGEAIAVSCGAT